MSTVLVTGANRGLGLEFCRQYLDAGWSVIATTRVPEQAAALSDLSRANGRLTVHRLDVGELDHIGELAERLTGTAIDVLINNAGVYGDTPTTGLGHLDYCRWAEVMKINAMAPVRLSEAFTPHLIAGRHRLTVAITSLMGSIADNGSGGSILYRSSKAALNAAMKSLSIDLRPLGIGVLMLHPGWVLTDMGGTRAPTTPQQSISGMRTVIDAYTPAQSGQFLNFRGESLPW
jgi:NAD(P)-dependent dehydrogenase (short-subunit alcohol dehydrogenase family)